MKYHLNKHGKGRTVEQYTKNAKDFYVKNIELGQEVVLKDGKIVTFWD